VILESVLSAVRVEGRDYVSQFKPLTGSGDRQELATTSGLFVGLAYSFQIAARRSTPAQLGGPGV